MLCLFRYRKTRRPAQIFIWKIFYLQIKDEDLTPTPEGPLHPPSPFLIVANKLMGGPVILNVGGKRHEVRWNTLDKFPTSRLGRLRHCVTHRGEAGWSYNNGCFVWTNLNHLFIHSSLTRTWDRITD